MKVMQNHDWYDESTVEYVSMYDRVDIRHIKLSDNELIISKGDAVEIAKEFGLVVYERNSNL